MLCRRQKTWIHGDESLIESESDRSTYAIILAIYAIVNRITRFTTIEFHAPNIFRITHWRQINE